MLCLYQLCFNVGLVLLSLSPSLAKRAYDFIMSQDHQLSLLNPLSGRESRVRASKDEGFSVSFITENQARLLEVVPEPAASTMSSLVNEGLHPANIVGSTKDLRLCAGTKSKRMTFIVLKDISALDQHQEIDVVVGQDSSEQYTDLLGMAEQRCIAATQTRKLTPRKSSP